MHTFSFIIFVILYNSIFWTNFVYSGDASPRCLTQLEVNFFIEQPVRETLNYNRIGQSSWGLIMTSLRQKSALVPSLMKKAAKGVNPNPLNYPFNPIEAKKILIPILYQIFKEALYEIQYFNETGIRNMFDFIYAHREQELLKCLGLLETATHTFYKKKRQ